MMKHKEGIDKVKVLLNPLFYDPSKINRHKDPYNLLTLHRAGIFTALSIHDEWFNPFLDYQWQIALAISELVREGLFNFPYNDLTAFCIYTNIQYFILNVVGIEFYSDFKEKNVKINTEMLKPTIDEAKEIGGLYQYFDKKTGKITGTTYTPDKKGSKKSKHTTYNKLEKSIKDNNHASVADLIKEQNPIRLEFRLLSNNCDWLHWDNLKGNYIEIFSRYLDYLAVTFNTLLQGNLSVKGNENPQYKKIIKTAIKDNRIRFTNKGHKLRYKEKCGADFLNVKETSSENNIEQKKEEIINSLSKNINKKSNILAIEKMREIARQLPKNVI
ncbi:MAG: hypothetical protein LBS55_13250, partial [Prevotellaceae bacterium]|nr:hypothetical protein [Prevotellaceae bacterium]